MTGVITALYRYPIKGFTPEPVEAAALTPGGAFPCDRLFAVENGPSGFNPDAPAFIPKQRFAVLARSAAVATVTTRYEEAADVLMAQAPGRPAFRESLSHETGRDAFARWLTPVLGDDVTGPLRMIDGRGHRFLDHPGGHVSILNLASVRDIEARLGVAVDPLRFRANLHVDGWAPWVENGWTSAMMKLGANAEASVFKPITRCAATQVDPATAIRDIDMTTELHRLYGHVLCGIYVQVSAGGVIAPGDAASLI